MIFITGIPTSGKTFYTRKHFPKKNYSVDYVYISMAKELGIERAEAGNISRYKDLSKSEFFYLKKKHYEMVLQNRVLPKNIEIFEGYGLFFEVF